VIDGIEVVDFHTHAGRWEAVGMVASAAEMVRVMDRAGIDRACTFDIFHPEGTAGNDAVLSLAARYRDRFVPFAYVSPLVSEGMVTELERLVEGGAGDRGDIRCRGIKVYPPYTPYPLDHDAWAPVLEFAAAHGLPVLTHTGQEETCQPRLLAEVAPRYPGATFVAGHAGNTAEYRRQAIDAARSCPNVYVETCSSYRSPGVIEELVEGAGSERVLFGSDMPLLDPRVQIGKIVAADIEAGDKRRILGENARRLLGL